MRKRLLVLSQCLPYPPHSGVANRTFNVLRQLASAYDVDLIAYSRKNHQPDERARAAARDALQRVMAFVADPTPLPNEQSAARKLWDHARSVLTGRPYTWYEYDSAAFRRRLHSVLRAREHDLVHLDSLDLYRWLPELPDVPVVCTHHNVESELLRRYALGLRLAPVRAYVLAQARRLERLERELGPGFALNVMVSSLDARCLRARAPGARTAIIPNGADVAYFQPRPPACVPGRVAFVGPTYSFPNKDAVEFLLEAIWTDVRRAVPGATLQLIGRNVPRDRARYAAFPGVQALGHVPDIRPALAEAACCVVPIRIGGGTRLKILDAWAMGKAIVSTSIGCEGLDAIDGQNILIRDTPAEFAAAVAEVLRNNELRERLERNARRIALETYSWDVIGCRLRAAYDTLIEDAPRRKSPVARQARVAV